MFTIPVKGDMNMENAYKVLLNNIRKGGEKVKRLALKNKREKSIIIMSVLFLVLTLLLWSSKSEAISFSVSGTVFPDYSTQTSIGGGVSSIDVEYKFYVYDAAIGATMNTLKLEFEKDVFDSIDLSSLSIDTSGWIMDDFDPNLSGDIMYLTIAPDQTLPPIFVDSIGLGDTLVFSLNVHIYDTVLSDDTIWDEGGEWEQAFSGITKKAMSTDTYGGSTAPVPEPTTLLLLGSGLLGFGIARKKKRG